MIHKQLDRKMLNHGIEFDVRECTSKRDVVGRLATIHFVVSIIQLICIVCEKKKRKFFLRFFLWTQKEFNVLNQLPSNISKSIDALE